MTTTERMVKVHLELQLSETPDGENEDDQREAQYETKASTCLLNPHRRAIAALSRMAIDDFLVIDQMKKEFGQPSQSLGLKLMTDVLRRDKTSANTDRRFDVEEEIQGS